MRKASLMRSAAFAAALAVGAIVGSGAAQAVSIVNGSFENGVEFVAPFVTLTATDSTSIDGWTVTTGSIDYIGTYWQASHGVRSLDMNGLSAGSVSQLVTGLTAGHVYQVSFDISGNPDAGPTTKTLGVTASVSTNFYNFLIGANTLSSMNWVTQSFQFVASDSSELLSFFSATACCGTEAHPFAFGPALDNVSILDRGGDPSATPLPAALPLFAGGLGVLGWLARRKKQKAQAIAA